MYKLKKTTVIILEIVLILVGLYVVSDYIIKHDAAIYIQTCSVEIEPVDSEDMMRINQSQGWNRRYGIQNETGEEILKQIDQYVNVIYDFQFVNTSNHSLVDNLQYDIRFSDVLNNSIIGYQKDSTEIAPLQYKPGKKFEDSVYILVKRDNLTDGEILEEAEKSDITLAYTSAAYYDIPILTRDVTKQTFFSISD